MTIYILKNENPESLMRLMSEQRLEKIDHITNETVKAEKICSYALLRYALFMEYGVSEAPVFSYGERGKPYLENYPRLHFSLSHAGGFSACAVSETEIGIDIQDIRPLKFDITAKICTEKELKAIYGGDSAPSVEACRLWCMKESRGKLTGKGFSEGFDRIETSELLEKGELKIIETENEMFVSACGYEPLTEIEIIQVTERNIRYILA